MGMARVKAPDMDTTQKDKILIPLRELYKQDVEHRDLIATYANNFKKRNSLSPEEFRFLVQRLNEYGVSFERRLFQAALAEPLLTVELVPHTCWFSNVRDHVNKKTWDKLRQLTYQKASYVCEICGGRGPKWPVECHEVWHYNDKRHIQTLVGLTALCPNCHAVKHIGLSGLRGKGAEAEAHLAKVNGWTRQETAAYLEKVWHTWQVRSRYEWRLDLNWLEAQGIKVAVHR
jgi:5-methylcytosine-specific restriction endonuclease McrA